MTRFVVLAIAALFIGGFGYLTLVAISEQGLTAAGLISIVILVVLGVGIVGALRNPPE